MEEATPKGLLEKDMCYGSYQKKIQKGKLKPQSLINKQKKFEQRLQKYGKLLY